MTCYYPLSAVRESTPGQSGKYSLSFSKAAINAQPDSVIKVPCGKCIGCNLEYARQWAVRCYHEASLYERNCFITLTFDDAHLPANMSLDKRDFQLFMKRLRKEYVGFQPVVVDGVVTYPIRYFHCGEYGELLGRPHYHACLFNFDFSDKVLHTITGRGDRLYTSVALSRLWPFGFNLIGDVTFESAAYVARYVSKKVANKDSLERFTFVDSSTGEMIEREPEYTTMSRRPGIGKGWFDKYMSDIYPSDFLVVKGFKNKPPRFYDFQYEAISADALLATKLRRRQEAIKRADDSTPARLKVRETVKLARISILKRGFDHGS